MYILHVQYIPFEVAAAPPLHLTSAAAEHRVELEQAGIQAGIQAGTQVQGAGAGTGMEDKGHNLGGSAAAGKPCYCRSVYTILLKEQKMVYIKLKIPNVS